MTPEDTPTPDPGAPHSKARSGAEFNDHFSGHAAEYAAQRPTYPRALFDYLAQRAPGRALAWDCATGNGQSALALTRHFDQVVATDASSRQLAVARRHERVEYRLEGAESSSLSDAGCDLVAVAQAVHWFDRERFYAEVRRVARPRGLVAVWTYDLLRVDPAIDRLIDRFHDETVAPYWPPERELVDGRYAGLDFPFGEPERPTFAMTRRWTVERALGYLGTWSAVRRYAADRGIDPLHDFADSLHAAWGSAEREVSWPLTVLAGRVD